NPDCQYRPCVFEHHRYDSSVTQNGRIRQALAYWCLNATKWHWNAERICQAAKELGCSAVELAPPDVWPEVKQYGLEMVLAHNGMPDPVFVRGLNNPRYRDEVIAVTKRTIDACVVAGVPNVIAFTGYKWIDVDDPSLGEIPRDQATENT